MDSRIAGFGLFVCALGLVAACGGSAVSGGNGTAAGSAGASSSEGGASSAGNAAGGASNAGASTGGTASGERCALPEMSGPCDAAMPRFWHNAKTGLCEPFTYGGCGGNDNRFDTREACQAACPGGGSNWGACKKDSECMLSQLGCCAACEPVSAAQFLALNVAYSAQEGASRPCASVGACAPCQAPSETTATGKYFKPVCVAGQCSLLDVRQSPITECSTSSDCILRDGVNCCSECDGGFVPVNVHANFCPDGPAICPKCASISPGYLLTWCEAGRCAFGDTLR